MFSIAQEYQNHLSNLPPDARRRQLGLDKKQKTQARGRSRGFTPKVREPRSVPRGAYSGRVFPNGEFTIGYVPPPRKRIDDSRYDRGEVSGYRGSSPECDRVDINGTEILVPFDEQFSSPLTSSTARNHHKPTRKNGKKGITAYGKRVVRNLAQYIQEKHGRKRVGFFTLTLPELPPPVLVAVCQKWSDLQRKYFQKLARYHKKLKKPFYYVSVTEIQSRRWERTGNPGYHIHYVCPVYKMSFSRGDYLVTAEWMREAWQSVLQNFINSLQLDGVEYICTAPRVGCELIKKSASAYLGKYMSKGGDLVSEVVAEMGEDCIPGQWWSCSSCLRRWFKSAIRPLSPDTIGFLFNLCNGEDCPFICYSHRKYIHLPHRGDVCISLSGRISALGISALSLGIS